MFRRILLSIAVLGVIYSGAQALNITGTNSQYRNSIFQVGMLRVSRDETITAFAGGGQASAYQLTAGLNRVATVGTSADSVKLPFATGGLVVIVINAGANPMNVFPQTGQTINALSANTAISVVNNKTMIFFVGLDGAWYSLLTA